MTSETTHAEPRSHELWILTAGREGARLFRTSRTAHGRLHVEERAALKEDWEELQHGRPSPLHGKDGRHYASVGHEEDERVHRFAKALSTWLLKETTRLEIDRLHVFASRRLLGELRKLMPHELRQRVRDEPLDLARLSASDLAGHAAIVALWAAATANG